MRLIPYSAIWDKILLPVLCCASFSGSKDLEERIGKWGSVFCFRFSFSLEVCPAPTKVVHSSEKSNKFSLFIALVLVSYFISHV